MSVPQVKFECLKCGSPLSYRNDTNQWYCSNCGHSIVEESYLRDIRTPEETYTGSGATVVATVQQKVVLPQLSTYKEFKELKQEVENIKAMLSLSVPKVVVIEEKSKEQAKKEVEEYFKENKTTDIEQLVINLRIDVRTLVEIIDELKTEGIIEESEETDDT